jgi:AP-3 complex subunit beta
MILEIKLDFFGKIITFNSSFRQLSFFSYRALLFQSDKCPTLSKHAKKILLAPKPAPILESIIRGMILLIYFVVDFFFLDHDQYTLGTLAFVIGQKATGYKDLPDFPLEPPDPSVRNVEIVAPSTPKHVLSSATAGTTSGGKKKSGTNEKFYSDEEEEEDTSTEGPDTDDEEEDEEEEEEQEKSIENENKTNEYEQLDPRSSNNVEQDESEEEDEESSGSSEEEESEEESESEESSDEEKVKSLSKAFSI